jgi:hypothetical protein
MLAMPGRRSDEAWAIELLERDVAVHPGQFYDCDDEACLVLSLIVEPAEFDEGLACIEALAAEV